MTDYPNYPTTPNPEPENPNSYYSNILGKWVIEPNDDDYEK